MRLVNPSAPLAVKVRLKKVQIPAHKAISRIASTTTHRWLRIYSRPPIWSMSCEYRLRQVEWFSTDDGIHHGADYLRGQGIEYGVQHGCRDCEDEI